MLKSEIHEADHIYFLQFVVGLPAFQLGLNHRCSVVEHPVLKRILTFALHLADELPTVFCRAEHIHDDVFVIGTNPVDLVGQMFYFRNVFRKKVVKKHLQEVLVFQNVFESPVNAKVKIWSGKNVRDKSLFLRMGKVTIAFELVKDCNEFPHLIGGDL